jgi:riboflavin synthase
MFTGIIEEIGVLKQIKSIAGGLRLLISAKAILPDSAIDDSIAVNGVCLTIVSVESNGFWAEAVGATLEKTTIKNIFPGTKVNLERALKLSSRLGGHLVQGHVNGVGRITALTQLGDNYSLRIKYPNELSKYIIAEGSIAVDGISLTISNLTDNELSISVIPHTWSNTNLRERKSGEMVNLETDLIAKYIERLLLQNSITQSGTGLNTELLHKLGF